MLAATPVMEPQAARHAAVGGRLGPLRRREGGVQHAVDTHLAPPLDGSSAGVATNAHDRVLPTNDLAVTCGVRKCTASVHVPRAHRRACALSERAPVLALVVLAVVAGADRLPPPGVLAVPGDGLIEPLGEVHLRLPAERSQLLGGERVA